MPSSATLTAFYSFSALTTIRSAEVNNNFNTFRGHIIPIDPNTATAAASLTYDLGSSDHVWRNVYAEGLYVFGDTVGSTVKHSSDWLIRFGDGTEERPRRAQEALDNLWTYSGDLFVMDEVHQDLVKARIAPDLAKIKATFDAMVDRVLAEATLKRPADGFMATGGREGKHGEQLGFILAEMQYLQRAYPGAVW